MEQIREEQRKLFDFYTEYEATLSELLKVTYLALQDDSYTEQSIVSLATFLNEKFES